MKKIILIFVLLAALKVSGQTNYYLYTIPYNPDPFTVGNVIPGMAVDDHYSNAIPIGFSFNFFGNNYNSLLVSTNGYITFDLTNANGYCPW